MKGSPLCRPPPQDASVRLAANGNRQRLFLLQKKFEKKNECLHSVSHLMWLICELRKGGRQGRSTGPSIGVVDRVFNEGQSTGRSTEQVDRAGRQGGRQGWSTGRSTERDRAGRQGQVDRELQKWLKDMIFHTCFGGPCRPPCRPALSTSPVDRSVDRPVDRPCRQPCRLALVEHPVDRPCRPPCRLALSSGPVDPLCRRFRRRGNNFRNMKH